MNEDVKFASAITTVARPSTSFEVKPRPLDVKSAARRKTVKMFRYFLKALDAELHLYNSGTTQNEFTMLCFLYTRRAVRAIRDEPPTTASQACVVTVLDMVTAWDEWLSRQQFSHPLLGLHETLGRMVKGALKGWRTYWIKLQLSDTPLASLDKTVSSAPLVEEGEEKDG